MAEAIADFFAEPHNVKVVDELLEQVHPQPLAAVERASQLAGKTVVFTGTLERMTRSEAKARAERLGARVCGLGVEKHRLCRCRARRGSEANGRAQASA